MEIPVIDIFAGPGGLGEGFCSANGSCSFDIKLSVEKDEIAHQTLELRSFLRSFGRGNYPDEYYRYVSDPDFTRQQLFDSYPEQAEQAAREAWKATLGKVKPSELHSRIDEALGPNPKHWVLLGGPPCQAYSLVGRARLTGLGYGSDDLTEKEREKLRKAKLKKFSKDERHTLYQEYLRIVAVHMPTVFVMENVKGILSSKHSEQPIFERIINDLRDPWTAINNDEKLREDSDLQSRTPAIKPRYRLFSFVKPAEPEEADELKPRDFIIRAEEYGIPQSRHRVIILGILEDYFVKPSVLPPHLSPCTVGEALDNLPPLRSGLSKEKDSHKKWASLIKNAYRKKTLKSLDEKVREVIEDALGQLDTAEDRGSRFIKYKPKKRKSDFHQWVSDPKLKGVLQHETRGHMTSDLWRYLYVSAYAVAHGQSPKVDEFPEWLLPEHKNVHSALKDGKKKPVHFRDRFKVQIAGQPSGTITSHISKDGHYYIHPDPGQCRSLTVREAARLQTFPDNYLFEGNRTQQYHQIGNAVPPFLANKLAYIVADVIWQCTDLDNTSEKRKSATG